VWLDFELNLSKNDMVSIHGSKLDISQLSSYTSTDGESTKYAYKVEKNKLTTPFTIGEWRIGSAGDEKL
jgi:hypothetical protein